MNGRLPYVSRHITVNKTFPSFLHDDAKTSHGYTLPCIILPEKERNGTCHNG